MAMYGSGQRIGTVLIRETQLSIRGGQTMAPTVSIGAAPGARRRGSSLRSAYRDTFSPGSRINRIGFRVGFQQQ